MSEMIGEKPLVLIVDDEPQNLHMMLSILGDRYTVIAATSGEQALELATQRPQPALILLDIMMPGMDGYEVLQNLKADPATKETPVIFVSALSEFKSELKGLQMGAVDYVSKPLHPDLLLARVQAQIELSRYRKKDAPACAVNGAAMVEKQGILVVDDQPENVHELVGALSGAYRIMVATNGPEALKQVAGDNPPDLILLDIKMPEMDGYEVCRRIKADEAGARIPVLFLSVVDQPLDKVRGFSLGAADYITKPFSLEEARARIHTHLELRRLRLFLEQQVVQRTAALRATTNEARAMLDMVPEPMFEVDMRGRFLEVHVQGSEFPGVSKAELVGKLLSEVWPPEAVAVCMSALHEAAKTGWSKGKQFVLPQLQVSCWFELSVVRKTSIPSPNIRFLVLMHDITMRKQAEEELVKAKEEWVATFDSIADIVTIQDKDMHIVQARVLK
jgi:PAS domain S-box-containing protein